MALNASGPISLGGATAGQSINLELGQSATATTSLNATNVRTLAGVASGAIIMPTNFYGKSNEYTTFTLGATTAVSTGGGAGQICIISPTAAIIVWGQAGPAKGASSVYARYVTISGTTVSLTGAVATLISNEFNTINPSLTNIDSTYSLLGLGQGGLRLLKLVGTTPTLVGSTILGQPYEVVGRQQGILTSTTYLIGMAIAGSGDSVKACVVTRSGDTISAGPIAAWGTGGMTAGQDSIGAAVNGSSTAGVVSYGNRVYPVTISGTTCTIGSGYITATGGFVNRGSCATPITPTANRYLLTATGNSGDNVGCVIFDQSGSSLTTYTGRNFGFVPGRIPATSWSTMMRGSSTVAAVRGEFGQAFGINISGTTISATRTNMLSSGASGGGFGGITTTQVLISVGGNTLTGVATVS